MTNIIFKRFLICFVVLFGLLGALTAKAQYTSDIDIYNGNSTNDAPNILFVLDNTANWSSAFTSEVSALITAFNSLPSNKFRVGLMMFTEPGGGNSGADGGYVRAAVRTLDSTYQLVFGNLLSSLDVNDDKTSGGKAGLTMAEAYYYFTGAAPNSGNQKNKTDYTGNLSGTLASKAVYALPGNALPSKAASTYVKPTSTGCTRAYIVYISNGPVQDNSSDTSDASSLLSSAYTAAGMTRPADLVISPNNSQSNVADEWARFMKASPAGVTTFTLDVNKSTNGQGPGWTALLKSMATQSGGDYFDVSTAGGAGQIVDALGSIFNQIQAVNSVFASASLPVSVNARGSYQNQVFMGMFRPDANANPRWRGNLKQYKFSYDPTTDSLFLSDALGNSAISGATGFISPGAVSYWTAASTFWANQLIGTPPSASDSPDGEVVEKGGVAQRLRTSNSTAQTSRKVYTCISCAANTNLATNPASQFVTSTSAITTTTLGVASSSDRDLLINWTRGTDNQGDEQGPGSTVTVRPSIHGDVLHSRPSVVNYGTSTGVVVFYGANDGTLRSVNGNQTTTISGVAAGAEFWSFLPEEHFSKLKRLRDNSPEVRLSTTIIGTTITSTTSPLPRDYFVDGPIGVYQKVLTDGTNDKVYIYSAMRRGGRLIYALDATTPSAPKFLWKKTSSDISILGQTWSEPKLAKIKGNTNPVIIMGAGYDPVAEDAVTPGANTMGNAVLVLDAFTGAVIKQFSTTRSVAADVTLIDSDYDGYVDRVYAVDLGGNIYRIDLETPTSFTVSDWSIYKIAALAGSGTRKFFYPPSVVLTANFAAILVGSGDREKPLQTTGTDAFFTVYDTRIVKGGSSTFAPITPSNLGLVGSNQSVVAGCYISMATGEKIVNAPATTGGITYFGTNKPATSSASCTANLGVATIYAAPLFCQSANSQTLVGGGLPPSPVTGVVNVSYISPVTGLTTSKGIPFIIGAPNPLGSSIAPKKVSPVINKTRTRKYWYLENTP